MLNHSDKNLDSNETVLSGEQDVSPSVLSSASTSPASPEEVAVPKEVAEYAFVRMDKYFLEDNYDVALAVDLSEKYKEITDQFKAGMLIRGCIIEREPRGILEV